MGIPTQFPCISGIGLIPFCKLSPIGKPDHYRKFLL